LKTTNHASIPRSDADNRTCTLHNQGKAVGTARNNGIGTWNGCETPVPTRCASAHRTCNERHEPTGSKQRARCCPGGHQRSRCAAFASSGALHTLPRAVVHVCTRMLLSTTTAAPCVSPLLTAFCRGELSAIGKRANDARLLLQQTAAVSTQVQRLHCGASAQRHRGAQRSNCIDGECGCDSCCVAEHARTHHGVHGHCSSTELCESTGSMRDSKQHMTHAAHVRVSSERLARRWWLRSGAQNGVSKPRAWHNDDQRWQRWGMSATATDMRKQQPVQHGRQRTRLRTSIATTVHDTRRRTARLNKNRWEMNHMEHLRVPLATDRPEATRGAGRAEPGGPPCGSLNPGQGRSGGTELSGRASAGEREGRAGQDRDPSRRRGEPLQAGGPRAQGGQASSDPARRAPRARQHGASPARAPPSRCYSARADLARHDLELRETAPRA